ncbi:MAG TPA: rRNA maturation factor, partial [Clostridiales bacterium]|nr:rRNA maturation factor [Clostridiales bacterium]
MTIHIENESEESLEFNYQEIIQKVVEECLDFEECPYEAEVNI